MLDMLIIAILMILFALIVWFGETHHGFRCRGKWEYKRGTAFGHYNECSRCGIEVYETDN